MVEKEKRISKILDREEINPKKPRINCEEIKKTNFYSLNSPSYILSKYNKALQKIPQVYPNNPQISGKESQFALKKPLNADSKLENQKKNYSSIHKYSKPHIFSNISNEFKSEEDRNSSKINENPKSNLLNQKTFIIKEKIKLNSEILLQLEEKFDLNKQILNELKQENKNVLLEHNLEKKLIRRFLLDQELEMIANQRFEEEKKEDYTYEELLEIGEKIGKVSKGLSEEDLERLRSDYVENSANCSICLITMEKYMKATVLEPCGHLYHFDCIRTWLQENKTCPLCLQEIIVT